MKINTKLLAPVLMLLGMCSCRTVYVSGKPMHGKLLYYEVFVDRDIQDTFKAGQKGLSDLDIKTTSATRDKLSGLITGNLANGKSLSVKLARISENRTRIRIQVGDLADEQVSTAIFEAIKKRLE